MSEYAELKKMIQIVINGQSAFKEEILKEFKNLREKIDNVDEKLTKRIDKIGRQLAFLEDDAPTRERNLRVCGRK